MSFIFSDTIEIESWTFPKVALMLFTSQLWGGGAVYFTAIEKVDERNSTWG